MQLALLDQILELEPGVRVVAVKTPTLEDEYLQDHFPSFPVMPGVLMLEAMYQASAWLLRVTDDFAHSMVLLREARNIKYSGFVKPGEALELQSTLQKREGNASWFKAEGRRTGETVVRAKLVIESTSLDTEKAGSEAVNRHVVSTLRKEFDLLYPTFGVKAVG